VVITVKNSSTGEVIRQIPDEALLRVAHNIDDIKGLLHNAST
jgi:flagellar protein FlaG